MNKPLVSVVMPTFNRKKYLDEAIESILNQTFKDFEFIIVDDGSTDGSAELVEKYAKKDSRIVYIYNNVDKGVIGASNLGIRNSKGKYIARMDSDDVCLPERLEKEVEFMENHPEIGACGSWVKTLEKNKEGVVWHLPVSWQEIKSTMLFCGAIANPTSLVRRSVFSELGFWYEKYKDIQIAEDYDFWTRIAAKNVKIVNIPQVLLLYRWHETNASTSSNITQYERVKHIMLRQLKTLGLSPTKDEIGTHQKIGKSEFIGGRKAIEKIENWTNKLLEANKKTKIYPEPDFSKIVEQKKKEAIEIHRKYRENFRLMPILIRIVGLTGKILRKILPGSTVDKIYKILIKIYELSQRKKEYFISKTEKYRIMFGFCTKLQKEVPEKFKIGMAVLAHERPEYLKLCLDSLFRTELHDYDITFLLQDDGSKDPRVKEIINTPRNKKYKIVRIFNPKGHNSWAGAFNRAMKKLIEIDDFDIIGSCDSDALFYPDWLDNTLKIALWAKKNHKEHVLGPFSSFNSSNYDFHNILGTYKSPFGKYAVKERMGALNYFYFKDDFLKLGYYPENKDDETLMTEKFKKIRVRYFSTDTSYADHIGEDSILNQWRPVPVKKAVFGMNLAPGDWGIDMEKIQPYGYYRYLKKDNSFGENVDRSGLKVDVLIPAVKKDLAVLPLTVRSVKKYLRHPIGNFYIVGPKDEILINFCKRNKLVFKNEDTVLPLKIGELRKIGYQINGWDRTGWIFQQFLKLFADAYTKEKNIFVIDADTVLIQPQRFETNGKTVLLVSDEYHFPYYDAYKKIFGYATTAPFSFVSHQMLLSADRLKELREEIEKKHPEKTWYQAILDNLNLSEPSSFSEYETYGNWMKKRRPEEISMEYFFNKSLSKNRLGSFDLKTNSYNKKYRSISFHAYNSGPISKTIAFFKH